MAISSSSLTPCCHSRKKVSGTISDNGLVLGRGNARLAPIVLGKVKRDPPGSWPNSALRSRRCPQHVVQRGNSRVPCFLDDEYRQRYPQCLRQALLWFGCRLHAHVLMNYHVHVLLTPDHNPGQSALFADLERRTLNALGPMSACLSPPSRRRLTGWPNVFTPCFRPDHCGAPAPPSVLPAHSPARHQV